MKIRDKESKRRRKKSFSSLRSAAWPSFSYFFFSTTVCRYSTRKLRLKVCPMCSRVRCSLEKLHLSWPEGRFNCSPISFSFTTFPYTVFFRDTRYTLNYISTLFYSYRLNSSFRLKPKRIQCFHRSAFPILHFPSKNEEKLKTTLTVFLKTLAIASSYFMCGNTFFPRDKTLAKKNGQI